jgi:hypothetical protein
MSAFQVNQQQPHPHHGNSDLASSATFYTNHQAETIPRVEAPTNLRNKFAPKSFFSSGETVPSSSHNSSSFSNQYQSTTTASAYPPSSYQQQQQQPFLESSYSYAGSNSGLNGDRSILNSPAETMLQFRQQHGIISGDIETIMSNVAEIKASHQKSIREVNFSVIAGMLLTIGYTGTPIVIGLVRVLYLITPDLVHIATSANASTLCPMSANCYIYKILTS